VQLERLQRLVRIRQPATFDHNNPAVRDFFFRGADNVTQHWYGLGASGWRFDVADDSNLPHN